jgi:hypothetical protein
MAFVTVHQITSKGKGDSFLNVEEEYGDVRVWGNLYERPTYLLQDGNEFQIVQFDDQITANEFFEEKGLSYKITKLEETTK